ncbi:MAG: GNAT family N-acetyltransferase [Oscillatoriales cyanobacterium C42_A2020_001]|nr:GNAT family N-acetyltransferase [Leptolyngbyaceae cyanobacterium C42_A2020_001]
MEIRSAHQSDVPRILPMIAKICALHQAWDSAKYGFLPHPERLYEHWLSELIKNSQDICLVAEVSEPSEASKLVAFLIATVESEIPIYHLQEFGFIHDLWVEEDYRQEGIAHQLVLRAIAHFSHRGVQQIRLDTAIANESARKLFSSCGFRPSTIEMLLKVP